MKLLYYRGRTPNFGDDLNQELWPQLAPELFERDDGAGFVGIGTIIGMPCDAALTLNVFSSGVGNDDPRGWSGRRTRFWCVRGPVSCRVLGLDDGQAITDGAILAPFAAGFPRRATASAGVVVIPHWQTLDFPGWAEVARVTGFEVLDPRAPAKAVVEKIASAAMVLTESLHGAIFADLLGIPWQVFATSRNFGVTKWIDWSRSLGRPFTVTMVPAPGPALIAVHGRRPEPLGTTRVFDLDDALGELGAHLAAAPARTASRARRVLKAAVARSPLAGRLLGYTPERTGAALARLARAEPVLTAPAVIESLQARLLEALRRLRRERGRTSGRGPAAVAAPAMAIAAAALGAAHAGVLPETFVPKGAPAFEDSFARLDAGPDAGPPARPAHRWRTIVKGGSDAAARSLSADAYFGDQTTSVDPFHAGPGGLVITATRQAGLPFGKTWNSGFLSTKFSFSFLHGYAEADADLPTCVKGAWAAPLWLLPVRGEWPEHGEVDAPETIGKVDAKTGLGSNHWSVLSRAAAGHTASLVTPMTCARGWHSYGVLWRSDLIGFYLERKLVAQAPTPSDYTEAMYLVMDLIVGGAWPGRPDASLQKVDMLVRRVSVWRE